MSRIIAGRCGGHRLHTPQHDRTRPTTDRVREAVFSTLATWAGGTERGPQDALSGVAFADFFAGSGAVGLEAASRGATPVLLVEADRRTARTAERNVTELGLPARVRGDRAERVLGEPAPRPFDVCWFDPPYELADAAVDALLAAAWDHGWVAADGLLAVERATRSAAPQVAGFGPPRSRRYGETTVHYLSRSRP